MLYFTQLKQNLKKERNIMANYQDLCDSIKEKNLKQAYLIVLSAAQEIELNRTKEFMATGKMSEKSLNDKKISKLCDAISLQRNCIIPRGFKRKTTKETIDWNNELINLGAVLN